MSVFHNNALIGSGGGAAADTGANITKSLRTNSADSAYLNRTPSSAGNRKTWTWSGWVKRNKLTDTQGIFEAYVSGAASFFIGFRTTTDDLAIAATAGVSASWSTGRKFVDPSAWYHVVAVVDTTSSTSTISNGSTDRIRLYVNGVQQTLSGGTVPSQNADLQVNNTIPHHLGRFQAGGFYSNLQLADVYLIDGQALAPSDFGEYDGNNVWQPKGYSGTYGTNGFHLLDFASESTVGHDSSGNENDFTANNISTTAGAGNDVLFDVPTNGTQSDTGAGGEVSGNYCTWNPLVGRYNDSGQSGTAPTFSNGNLNVSGGQTNDRIAGTFNFNVGQSGKYYWEVTFTDSPVASNGAGVRDYSAGTSTLVVKLWYYSAETVSGGPAVGWGSGDVLGFAMDLSAGTIDCYKNGGSSVGQMDISSLTSVTPFVQTNNGVEAVGNFGQRAFAYNAPSGYKALCTTNLADPTIADGSTAFDTALYSGNGSSQTITGLNLASAPDFVWIKTRNDSISSYLGNTVVGINKNLESNNTQAESTNNVYGYVSATTSDGFTVTAGSASSILVNGSSKTYVGWAWDAGANSSKTYTVKVVSDSGNKYRFDDFGTSAVTLDLEEGSTYVFDQSDSSNSGHPLRFSTTSDGTHNSGSEYTTGVTTTGTPGSAGAKTTIVVAASAPTLYYYCSSHSGMGGQANTNSTAGASNFAGSIQSTVRANASAGFSIVKFAMGSGSYTVGHGLGAAPSLLITKSTSNTSSWWTYHESLGTGSYLALNSTAAAATDYSWGTAPTSTVFTANNNFFTNGYDYIVYCFAPVEGFSAFGEYTGNGSTDGPFVFTGHRSQFLFVKQSSASGEDWWIVDTTRETFNPQDQILLPNSDTSEITTTNPIIDILSNGFKIRNTNARFNGSGATYVFASFASHPFKTARAR